MTVDNDMRMNKKNKVNKEKGYEGIIEDILPEDAVVKMIKEDEVLSEVLSELREGSSNFYIESVCEEWVIRVLKSELQFKVFCKDAVEIKSNSMDALEIKSNSMDELFRRAALVEFQTSVNIYEGEVVSLRNENDSSATLVLRNSKQSAQLQLCPSLATRAAATLSPGDVAYVEPGSGIVQRLGRSEARQNEHDLEGDRFVQLKKGPISQRRDKKSILSLYDLDYSFSGYSAPTSSFVRHTVDRILASLSSCRPVQSALVITSAHLLALPQLRRIEKLAEELHWVRVILLGSQPASSPVSYGGAFLYARVQLPLSPYEILKMKHDNYEEYSSVVSEYIDRVDIEVISEAINVSKSISDFKILMESQ